MKFELDEEQIHHLIDLLRMNIRDKLINSHNSKLNEEQTIEAIAYDCEIVEVLEEVVDES